MPSLLHSTTTVDDGGGLTLQGNTTVWPTNASTVDGSDLSMDTSPKVKLAAGPVCCAAVAGEGRRVLMKTLALWACVAALVA